MKPISVVSDLAVRFDPDQLRAAVAECEQAIAALTAERERAMLLLATYRQLLQLHDSGAQQTHAQKTTATKAVSAPGPVPRQQALPLATRLKGMKMGDAAFRILSEAGGRPMHGKELLEAMRVGGRPVEGKQPASSLMGALLRDKRFARAEGPNTWKLAAETPTGAR